MPPAARELYSGQGRPQHVSTPCVHSFPHVHPSATQVIYFLSCCYSKQAFFQIWTTAELLNERYREDGVERGMKSWTRKKEQQEKFSDSFFSALGITSQRKWCKVNHLSHLKYSRQNTKILHSHQKFMHILRATSIPPNQSFTTVGITGNMAQIRHLNTESRMSSLAVPTKNSRVLIADISFWNKYDSFIMWLANRYDTYQLQLWLR